MQTETYTIGQCDDNDMWLVLRGDEVVADYYSREAAQNERDRRNMEAA